MAGEQDAEGSGELTAWLEADDAKSRALRARRLRDLLDILPVPEEGLSFLGGEESLICFGEVRRCYLDGSYMATVLLSLAFVERELAVELYKAGWGRCEERPAGGATGKGLRRRCAVGVRVADVPRPGPAEELTCPLPRSR